MFATGICAGAFSSSLPLATSHGSADSKKQPGSPLAYLTRKAPGAAGLERAASLSAAGADADGWCIKASRVLTPGACVPTLPNAAVCVTPPVQRSPESAPCFPSLNPMCLPSSAGSASPHQRGRRRRPHVQLCALAAGLAPGLPDPQGPWRCRAGARHLAANRRRGRPRAVDDKGASGRCRSPHLLHKRVSQRCACVRRQLQPLPLEPQGHSVHTLAKHCSVLRPPC